jgi:hypothetical protein
LTGKDAINQGFNRHPLHRHQTLTFKILFLKNQIIIFNIIIEKGYNFNFQLLVRLFRNFHRNTFSSPFQSRPLLQLHRQRVEYFGRPDHHGGPIRNNASHIQ